MLLMIIVFVSAFAVTALLVAAAGLRRAEAEKQTLSRLDALLATGSGRADDFVNVRKTELFSSIPLLNRLLVQLETTVQLKRLLYQANLQWTPARLILLSLSAWMAAAQLVYMRTGEAAMAMFLGAIPAAAPFTYVMMLRARQFNKFEEGLPATLDLMVSALRSGHSVVSAIGLVAREAADPIGREFRLCFDEQNYGLELRTALENMAVRVPLQDIRIIMTAILVQKETGGNLAEVLEKCAHIIRERFRLKREIRVRTAQGRLTGWVLSLMPPGLGFLMYLMEPDFVSLLWRRETGIRLMCASVVMTTIGALLIRKIVRIRV